MPLPFLWTKATPAGLPPFSLKAHFRYPLLVNQTCVVSFKTPQGHEYAHVTAAATLHEAVRNGIDWFAHPHWRGPRPTASPAVAGSCGQGVVLSVITWHPKKT